METTIAAGLEDRLLRPAGPGRFDPAELDGLPAPVRRHLTQAIAPGTPPHTAARLRMRGAIRVGAGCRSGPARSSTPTRASSGRPGRPG